ncbi:MAG TPA: hypothetical protein VMB26_06775, partial [Candidatus Binataceae bacterium]|nr:hypothetical protein [Candidatus Binataceae bacterium]
RVTVIATGFGDFETRYVSRPTISAPVISHPVAPVTAPIQSAPTRVVEPSEAPTLSMAPVKNPTNKPIRRMGLIVDDSLDVPTFKRRAEEAGYGAIKLEPSQLVDSEDNLDIPTFLRKQD